MYVFALTRVLLFFPYSTLASALRGLHGLRWSASRPRGRQSSRRGCRRRPQRRPRGRSGVGDLKFLNYICVHIYIYIQRILYKCIWNTRTRCLCRPTRELLLLFLAASFDPNERFEVSIPWWLESTATQNMRVLKVHMYVHRILVMSTN